MECWTLVYRVHRHTLASRRRIVERYGDAMRAYDTVLIALQPKRAPMMGSEVVSHAYLIRPEGEKIPLVSGVPPHHAIAYEQFKQAVTQPGPIPAQHEHRPVEREILHRRLVSAFLPALPISEEVVKVLGQIDKALFWGSEQKLATVCELALGPPGAAPRACPPEREPLRRRLHALAKQAQTGFPDAARVLTYLEHALAQKTESRLLTACEQVELFTGRILGEHGETVPVKKTKPYNTRKEHSL
jgi:hypothetical protein